MMNRDNSRKKDYTARLWIFKLKYTSLSIEKYVSVSTRIQKRT
jgi:hypothetical protein